MWLVWETQHSVVYVSAVVSRHLCVCVRVCSKHPKQKCLSSMHLRYRLQLLLAFKLNAGASVAVFLELSVPIYLSHLISVHKYTEKIYMLRNMNCTKHFPSNAEFSVTTPVGSNVGVLPTGVLE